MEDPSQQGFWKLKLGAINVFFFLSLGEQAGKEQPAQPQFLQLWDWLEICIVSAL